MVFGNEGGFALRTLKVLEGEGRARRDRVNANQERVSIKIALNLPVWSLVAWISHLAALFLLLQGIILQR